MGNLKEFVKENIEMIKNMSLIDLAKLNHDFMINDSIYKEKNEYLLYFPSLSSIDDKLRQLDEFENVKKINYVALPVFLVDSETETPVNSSSIKTVSKIEKEVDESNGEIKMKFVTEIVKDSIPIGTKPIQVETYKLSDDNDHFKFNEEIDIYSIKIVKKYDFDVKLGKGVWKFPTKFDGETFEALNEIKIIFSEEEMINMAEDETKDILFLSHEEKLKAKKELVKKSILERVSKTFDNEPNIPFDYDIFVRCSPRSFIV